MLRGIGKNPFSSLNLLYLGPEILSHGLGGGRGEEGRRRLSSLARALCCASLPEKRKEKEKSSVVFSASDGRDAVAAPGTKTLRDKKSYPPRVPPDATGDKNSAEKRKRKRESCQVIWCFSGFFSTREVPQKEGKTCIAAPNIIESSVTPKASALTSLQNAVTKLYYARRVRLVRRRRRRRPMPGLPRRGS